MKFLSFSLKNENRCSVGVFDKSEGHILDINSIGLEKVYTDMNDVIQNITTGEMHTLKKIIDSVRSTKYNVYKVSDCVIKSPIPRPRHDIICVGVNYREHLEEKQKNFDKNFSTPEHTVYFSKRAIKTIGTEGTIDGHFDLQSMLDYEVELGVIIGKTGVDIPKEKAKDYIFGYTIINDISARGIQKNHVQWFRGKGLDTFCAMGPVVIDRDSIEYPPKLNLSSRVNGELRQSSNTKYMISSIDEIISEFSGGITLESGDIIATGTPSGVGFGFKIPKFMSKGDTVECEIESIGVLKNYIK